MKGRNRNAKHVIAKLKRGEWIPVHKEDDKQRDINYRPITVLACMDKVYEVLLGQQVESSP